MTTPPELELRAYDFESLPVHERLRQNEVFDRIRLKADWAHDHIDKLDRAIGDFLTKRHFRIRDEQDSETLEHTYRFIDADPFPPEIVGHVGDALHNLRSSLDHLVWQLVIANGKKPCRKNSFPIFDPERGTPFAEITKETLKGVHPKAVEAIEKLEPFYDLLWLLHRLDILDKHREILALGPAHVGHDALASDKTQMEERWKEALPDSQFFPFQDVLVAAKEVRILKGGEVLRRVPHSDWEQDMGFHFDVWFDIPDAVGAKNVIDTLKEMERVVFNIICDFKTKGHLGLAPITSPSSTAPAAIVPLRINRRT